jgi:pSer/pThr/pTyr-binding forkhead associated (FHA) protein
LRFEIRYPTGATHEVELQGTVAILGRDPSCDLVINDVKCSRRHAVMEAGPDGLVVRDSGSANGVYVNGREIDRAAFKEGDVVAGDVSLSCS